MCPLVQVMTIGAFLSKHYNSVHDNSLSQLQVGTTLSHHPAAAGSRSPTALSQIWNTVPFIHQRPVIKPLVALIKGRHNVVLKSPGHRQLLLKSLSIFLFSFACTLLCSRVFFSPLSWSHISLVLRHTSTPWRLAIASCLASSPCVIATRWSEIHHVCILIYSCRPQTLFLNI